MIGFLVAVVAVLFCLMSTPNVQAYKRSGYLDILFFLFFWTLGWLVITAFLSIAALSPAFSPFGFYALVILFTNNIFQVIAITVIIFKLAKDASKNEGK